MTTSNEEWVKDVRSARLCFDADHVLVCSIASSEAEFPSAHMGRPYHVLDRPVDDKLLVELVRSCWEDERRSSLDRAEMEASWDPICQLFGHDRYDEANYISVNRHIRKRPGFSMEAITVAATRWRNGNREFLDEAGRSELSLDASDDELATAIRLAISTTSGPHDK